MRGSKLRVVVIKKQYFGVTSKIVKAQLMGWDTECKRELMSQKNEISCLEAVVVIGFSRGLWVEEVFITSLKVTLKFWE